MTLLVLVEKMVDKLFAWLPQKLPSSVALKQALVVAHRGAHNKVIIENTLESFQAAKDLGCWGIEFDIRSTQDGVLVVNHDSTLKRLWEKEDVIASLTFAQLRILVPAIPSLQEVISSFGQSMHLFIELKSPFAHTKALYEALAELRPCEDYHLIMLDDKLLPHLSDFPKQALLLVAGHNNIGDYYLRTVKGHYGGLLGNYLLFKQGYINALKANGFKLGVGFINSKNSLYRELNRGVGWLFTNQAEKISQLLKRD